MGTNGENTQDDKIKISIAFIFISIVTVGVLLVAFGFFDQPK
ncbi:MAG: hypothetical protein ACK48V_10880 [Crocinitomicaceae bacterium]|jgi:hypothetical protein